MDTLSVADAIALRDRDGDGVFGDGNCSWILVLFAILLMGGGLGGFGWGIRI